MLFRIAAAALVLGAGLSTGQSPDTAYERAAGLFRDGKPAQAASALRELTRSRAADPRVWNLLGVILDNQKDYDQAEQCFRKALQLSPGSAAILNNLGNHYVGARKPEQAIATFRKVLSIDPGHPNANLQLATLLVDRGEAGPALNLLAKLDARDAGGLGVQLLRARALHAVGRKPESAEAFRAAEQTASGPAEWYSIGITKAAVADYEGAERCFSRALEVDPANPDILHDLGLAALRAGHAPRAQEVFETILHATPEDPEALFQLGRALAAQGRNDDAILVLAQARRLAPSRPEIVHTLAVASAQAGFFGDAALAFDDYLKLRPDDEAARRERGFAYSCAGKRVEALRDLEWYVARHPADPQGRFELGFALSVSDVQRSIANLNEAMRLKPDFPEAHLVRGEIYAREGKPGDAVKDLEYAVARRPEHIRATAALGRVYLQLDRPQDAVRVLRTGYQQAPRDPQILMTLGRALVMAGETAEGERILDEFAKVGPDRSLARATPGVLQLLNLSEEEFDKRYEANLRSALVTRRGDPEVRSRLAAFLLSRDRKDEALAEYRGLLAGSPPTLISVDCGRTLVEAGEFALAVQFLSAAASGGSPGVALDLAIALIGNDQAAAAIQQLDRIPEKDRLGDYYLVRAQALDALGQVGSASDSLRRALDNAPTRPDLYIQAAYFLLRHERDADALALVRHAARQIPGNANLLLLQAVLLATQRQTDEALSVLRTITGQWPEWGRPYLIRGIIEENHSDSDAALKSIGTAIAMGERSAEAYYYLAQATYHATPDGTRRASDAIRKSLDLNPADPWAQALAGRLAWESRDFDASVRYLQEAMRLKKDFVKAHFWLGATYRSMGRNADADRELAEVAGIHERNPRAESEDLEGSRDQLFGVRR